MKVLYAVLFVLAAVAIASAQDNTDVKRFLKILHNPNKEGDHTLQVRAVQAGNGNVDSIVFLASSKRIPRFAVRYFHKEADAKELLAARWRIWKVFQYVENGDAGSGFDPDTDTIVSDKVIRLWDDQSNSGNSVFTSYNFTINNGTGDANDPKSIQFCNMKGLENSDERVEICCTITAVYDENMDLTPNGVKWSISVENLAWDGPIAIKTSFDTLSVLSSDDTTTDSGSLPLGSAGDAQASASWVKTVSIDGTNCDPTADIVKSVVFSGQVSNDQDDNVPDETDDAEVTLTAQITYFSIIPSNNCAIDSFYWDPILEASNSFIVQPAWALLVLLAYFLF